jgi:hypothetical protein
MLIAVPVCDSEHLADSVDQVRALEANQKRRGLAQRRAEGSRSLPAERVARVELHRQRGHRLHQPGQARVLVAVVVVDPLAAQIRRLLARKSAREDGRFTGILWRGGQAVRD